jgi:hypothetical protein
MSDVDRTNDTVPERELAMEMLVAADVEHPVADSTGSLQDGR